MNRRRYRGIISVEPTEDQDGFKREEIPTYDEASHPVQVIDGWPSGGLRNHRLSSWSLRKFANKGSGLMQVYSDVSIAPHDNGDGSTIAEKP
jgi:hypothetical protein